MGGFAFTASPVFVYIGRMTSKISEFLFGPAPSGRLPDRVRLSIESQQVNGERLIGLVQLSLVGLLGVLYLVSPKTSVGTAFSPVPWALAFYLSFTVLRIYIAFCRTLPHWFLMISVVMDISLLMVLIWSFHIQYEQPPSFYLKAPTLLYVFIFIALRALRFEPRYVAAAGLTAAAGWIVLMLYVMFSDPADMMITRNYVQYMTSNSVLIGAEIDKIVSILMVTFVLAVAVERARRMLIRATAEAAAAKDLSRFVSADAADRITRADKRIRPGDGEVREATVMFTDIEGFSTLSEKLAPQDLIGALNDYFAALAEVIGRHGGVINQFVGDAMLITFNTSKDDPDHAANAVRTALGIQDVVNNRRFGLDQVMKTRCGINSGTILSGTVGSEERLIFTVHGDEVNVAARLEQLNKVYGTYILVTDQTRAACGDAHGFDFDLVGEVTVKGRTQPSCVFALRTPWDQRRKEQTIDPTGK